MFFIRSWTEMPEMLKHSSWECVELAEEIFVAREQQ